MNVPENLRYTSDHEWVLVEDGIATVGITDHAQDELTDVVYVDPAEVGNEVEEGDPAAVVESVKAASDIYSPLDGEIVEANGDLDGDPALVNTDPYGKGWIFKLKLTDPESANALMDAAAYKELIG